MLLGYSMPVVTAVALSGNAGSAWLTVDGGAACYDGKPARKARLQWAADVVPDVGDYVQVDLTIAATSLRICAVLGLTGVPVGTVVQVYGKRAGDAGATWDFGGQNAATVVQFPDGTAGAWFVLPAAAEAVTVVGFRIYNDAAAATWATAATAIDIGELVAMPAVDIPIDKGWAQQRMDPSMRSATRSSQPATSARTPFRVLSCAFSPSPSGEAPVRFGGLDNGMDWEAIAAAVAGDNRCAAIPRWADTARVQATAQYGICTGIGPTQHVTGPFWRKEMTFQEVPAI